MISSIIGNSNELRVVQSGVAPTVYLDHWALRLLSEEMSLRHQFIVQLKASNGTLALSWLNLIEFSQMESNQAHTLAEDLLDQLLPNIFFMEINPYEIIRRENKLIAGERVLLPLHADNGFLEVFIKLGANSSTEFSTAGLFTPMHKSAPVQEEFAALTDQIVRDVKKLRAKMNKNEKFQNAIRQHPSGPSLQRGTRYVLQELTRTFLVNQSIKISRNNAIDIMHSVVPIAYCDFVLLDKHWEQQISCIRKRLKYAEMEFPIARVFSKKNSGIENFFQALEKYNGHMTALSDTVGS